VQVSQESVLTTTLDFVSNGHATSCYVALHCMVRQRQPIADSHNALTPAETVGKNDF